MPSIDTSRPQIHTLSLLPNLESGGYSSHQTERTVNRRALLNIAPDREDQIVQTKNIETLRNKLKIRSDCSSKHWLYNTRLRIDARVNEGVSRRSVFIPSGESNAPDNRLNSANLHVVRKVVPSVALHLDESVSPTGIAASRPRFTSFSLETWDSTWLSTEDKLISPRPLDPTHILLVHEVMTHGIPFAGVDGQTTLRRRKPSVATIYPRVLEIPINDLLFTLNVPNMPSSSGCWSPSDYPILPPRMHKELPRVLMSVPHINTFHELVVYLHTKNQAELFRQLLPEWIRDILHPLPISSSTSRANSPLFASFSRKSSVSSADEKKSWLSRRRPATITPGNFFSSFSFNSKTKSTTSTSTDSLTLVPNDSSSTISSSTRGGSSFSAASSRSNLSNGSGADVGLDNESERRTVDEVAMEIAKVASSFTNIPTTNGGNDNARLPGPETLIRAVSLLNALKDNLEYIGYFGATLWKELEITRGVLVKALSCLAKVEPENDVDLPAA